MTKEQDFLIEKFDTRLICIKGVGKLFYQEGFPISLSIAKMKESNIEVSLLHVADECLKNGWSAKTTYNKLKADFEDDIHGNVYDYKTLKQFCFANYEDQREMILNYLFNNNDAKSFIKEKLI